MDFMNEAVKVSRQSSCVMYQVGAVLVKDGKILLTGYNSTHESMTNCKEIHKLSFERLAHNKFSSYYETHAEMKIVTQAARLGISIDNTELYCTLHPCINCIKHLIQSGVKKIYYKDEYDLFSDDEKLAIQSSLQKAGVTMVKYQ